MYLVKITQGLPHETFERLVFVTKNEETAKNFVTKFNKICEENKERIYDNYSIQQLSFWSEWIVYDDPVASYIEIIER